jgi:dienelactone hydrolase
MSHSRSAHKAVAVLICLTITFINSVSHAQHRNPLVSPVVYSTAGMDKVRVQRDVTYKTAGGQGLKLDIYHPENAQSGSRLPLVIFMNGVGDRAPKIKDWASYVSWARLVAVTGFAAVLYETRPNDSATDTEDLISYVRNNAATLMVDENRICVWSGSANNRIAFPLTMQESRKYIRCAVFYYGTLDSHQIRRDVPLFIARAGQDIPAFNNSIDAFIRLAASEDITLQLASYVRGRHGFDVFDDTDESRSIIKQTLDFIKFHLSKSDEAAAAPTPSRFYAAVAERGIQQGLQLYEQARKADPNAVLVQENTINALGYQLLQNQKPKEAVEVFKLNLAAYPRSANVYDSLADGYEAAGNKEMAIQFSEKTLEVLAAAGLPEEQKNNIRNSATDKLRRLKGHAPEAGHTLSRLAATASAHRFAADPEPRVYRFEGGLWFNGKTFEPRTVYSVDGVFRAEHSGQIDSTIDLRGKYVIPPFAEAHNHHFMEGTDYQSQINTYFAQGIFYAKVPNSIQKLTDPIRALFNKPGALDVIFSNGGLTATGGHPVQIYDFIAERKILPGLGKEDMKGQAYFIIDSQADLQSQWAQIKAGKPDFIKVYLEFSEEYDARKSDPKFYGRRGLDPALLPKIVARAHKDNLRVTAHVNTAADFHNALAAGVDEVAHLPLARVSEADARLAASRGVVVTTTTMSHRSTDHVTGVEDIHRHNIELLQKAGVKLAIGTDDNNRTVLDEVENLYRLKVFDNLTLLKLWTESTPQAIFPARKIGQLKEGFEASFLALDANPLEDFASVRKISVRLKQGRMIR